MTCRVTVCAHHVRLFDNDVCVCACLPCYDVMCMNLQSGCGPYWRVSVPSPATRNECCISKLPTQTSKMSCHSFTSFVMRHMSCVIRHASFVMRHTSCVIRHVSYVMRHTSCIVPHASYVMHHTTCIIRHASCVIPHASYVMRHTSHVMRHTSCVMRRASR